MYRNRLVATLLCFAACSDGEVFERGAREGASAEGNARGADAATGSGDAANPPPAEAGAHDGDRRGERDDAGGALPVDASASLDAAQASAVAAVFDGVSGYVEIPDDDAFSEPAHGGLTVEAWLRPDSLAMPHRESTGYVHWLGKGEPGQHEWVARMYQQGNSEGRANRISFYAFNLTGGQGAGSYVQETVTPGEWIHYVGEFDGTNTFIFKNGEQRDTDPLSGYNITPKNGTAPLRIGTRDLASFFEGAISRVAIYAGKLDSARVRAHASALGESSYDDMILAEPSLVAFYKLDESSGTMAHDAKGNRHGAYHGGMTLAGAAFSR